MNQVGMTAGGLLGSYSRLKIVTVFVGLLGLLLFVSPPKASALPTPIPSTVAPAYIISDVNTLCNSGYGVVQEIWLSPQGSPSATARTVAYGTPSVSLQLNYLTYRCKNYSYQWAVEGYDNISSTSPSISALNGTYNTFPYVPQPTLSYRSGVVKTFTYGPAGGFTSTQNVTITTHSKGILKYYDKASNSYFYQCAAIDSRTPNLTTSSTNYAPCWDTTSVFSMSVTVVAPATLDGAKIDDSGYDATTRPYGGATATPASVVIPYSVKTVSVSGSGSDARNPFYFDASSGGGSPIVIDTTGDTVHTVSIDTSGLPLYRLVGYSMCYTGQSNCTSAGLAYGGTYYSSLPSGTSSFSFNFTAGRAYHMRWIFKAAVGVSCGSFTTSPGQIDNQTRFTANATVVFSVPYTPVGPTVALSIAPAVPFNGNPSTVVPVVTSSGGNTIATATYGTSNAALLGPAPSTGVYTATWQYDDAGLAPVTCTDTFQVTNQPYLHVYGGDVLTGTAVVGDTGSRQQTCSANPAAGAYSWNNHASDFSGAGAQYAVMALGQILDFSSASGLAGSEPSGLSFANSGLNSSQLNTAVGLFGGSFGGMAGACDFTSDITVPPVTTGDVTIGTPGASLAVPANGVPDIRYVVGHDVYITGTGIRYDTPGGWASIDTIPYFKLVVVGGSIYIDKNVTQLDGIYIAEAADDGSGTGTMQGGNIYTCATGIRTPVDTSLVAPATADANTFYVQCGNKLTINGAFAAQQIRFLRTFGTLGAATTDTQASNNAAEVFNYSPEAWLPRSATIAVGGKYDAITGLPPVL